MTIQKLERYKFIKNEVKKLEAQIMKLQAEEDYSGKSYLDVTSGSSASFPYMKQNYVIEGVDKTRYYERLKKLNDRLGERQKEISEIEAFIDTINESDIWQIIQYKYVEGLAWLAVSRKVYGEPSENRARMRIIRFLEKI